MRSKLLAVVGVAGLVGGIFVLLSQQRMIGELRQSEARTRQQLEKLSAENTESKKWKVETTKELERVRAQSTVQTGIRVESNSPKPVPVAAPRQVAESSGQKLMPHWDPEKKQRQLANWHRRYDEFFQQRGLSTVQVDRLLELFALQDEARTDLQAAVEQSGLPGDTPGVEKLRSELYEPITREMRQILTEEGYVAYNKYQVTSFYRVAYIDPMAPQFISANAPLSPEQRERLVDILTANKHLVKVRPTDIGSEVKIDWDAVATQATTVLTPVQIAVLQAYGARQSSSK